MKICVMNIIYMKIKNTNNDYNCFFHKIIKNLLYSLYSLDKKSKLVFFY